MEILSLEFFWALVAIILIDVVLGGENALVIAMAANQLPQNLQRKAIIWGTFGAVAVRFICVAALTYLLLIPGLRLIGGLLLIWIAWRLTSKSDKQTDIKTVGTFWGAMGTIVMADAVMGLDNALAIAGAANSNWILIILGLLISVPIILFGSTIVSKVIIKYPSTIFVGAFVLYVVAWKMILAETFVKNHIDPLEDWIKMLLPWCSAVILTAKQYYKNNIK